MVGEATRMPIIEQIVRECFGIETTSRTLNSTECIARGCAIQAAMLSPLFKVKDFGIIDYHPFPIEVIFSLPKPDANGNNVKSRVLFDKGSNFPIVKSLSFEGRREQLDLQLKYNNKEEEIPAGSPHLLGNYRITVPEPNEEKFTLVIKIKLDTNGICQVSSSELIEEYLEEKKIPVKKDKPALPPAPAAPAPKEGKKEEKKEDKKEEKKEDKKENKKEEKKEEKKEDKKEVPKDIPEEATEKAKTEGEEEPMKDVPTPTDIVPPPVQPEPPIEYEIQTQKKNRKRNIDFLFEVHGLQQQTIAEFRKDEKQMSTDDFIILSTKEKKNQFEAYIYGMREKLETYGEYKPYLEEKTRVQFLSNLVKEEEWLYNEGQSQVADVYQKRLEQLQNIGEDVIKRYRVYNDIPFRITQLEKDIQLSSTFLETLVYIL